MNRIVLSIILAFVVFAPVSARRTLPATDTFDRNASTLGTDWTNTVNAAAWVLLNAATASPNHYGASSSAAGADFTVYYNNLDTYTNDQYAQVVISKGSSGYQGVCVRADNAGNAYCATLDAPCTFYKFISGTRSTLGTCSAHSWTNGHTLKLDVVGDTLTVYDNSVSFGTQAGGSAISAGSAGIIGYQDATSISWDWQGGNVGGGATFPTAILNTPIRGGGR